MARTGRTGRTACDWLAGLSAICGGRRRQLPPRFAQPRLDPLHVRLAGRRAGDPLDGGAYVVLARRSAAVVPLLPCLDDLARLGETHLPGPGGQVKVLSRQKARWSRRVTSSRVSTLCRCPPSEIGSVGLAGLVLGTPPARGCSTEQRRGRNDCVCREAARRRGAHHRGALRRIIHDILMLNALHDINAATARPPPSWGPRRDTTTRVPAVA